MAILGLEVPEGQKLWFWSAGECGHLLFAKNYDEAYRKVMAIRLHGATDPTIDDVNNAQRWFSEHDHLEEIEAEYTGEPYQGEIPDIDD